MLKRNDPRYLTRSLKLLVITLILSCSANRATKHHNHPIIVFLRSGPLIYSTKKQDIPVEIRDVLHKNDSAWANLGDSTDLESVDLTDFDDHKPQYHRLLNYVLIRDSVCLISYTQGGVATHTVVLLVNRHTQAHDRYDFASPLADTTALIDQASSAVHAR